MLLERNFPLIHLQGEWFGDVDTEAAMGANTLIAEDHAYVGRGPCKELHASTVSAHLVAGQGDNLRMEVKGYRGRRRCPVHCAGTVQRHHADRRNGPSW